MAVTKTLTGAVPYNLNSKVQQWDFTMQYEDGADATYYTSTFTTSMAELTALCPISTWDTVFASQYDSVITNPPDDPVPDPDYVIPS